MAKDFEVGQKAYLCFNEPELVTIVKSEYWSKKSRDIRIQIKHKDGTITDPIPSLVFHSKLQCYKDYLLPKLEVKIKRVKKRIRNLEKGVSQNSAKTNKEDKNVTKVKTI